MTEHELTPIETLALQSLASVGPDQMSAIDSDEKLAAAIVYSDLHKCGFVSIELGCLGPIVTITRAGCLALYPEDTA